MISTVKNRNVLLVGAAGAGGITDLTGDVTATGPGSVAATLTNSGVTAGTKGDATNVAQITVDAKGRVTVLANVPITPYSPPTYTLGSVIFAGVSGVPSQNNSNFFWDNSNIRLGIGNASPSVELHVTGSIRSTALTAARVPVISTGGLLIDSSAMTFLTASSRLVLATAGQTLDGNALSPLLHLGGDNPTPGVITLDGYGLQPAINMRRSQGTQASKSAVLNTNALFQFNTLGWDGSVYGNGGIFRFVANGNYSGSNYGTDFVVLLTANGAIVTPTERLRMSSVGLSFDGPLSSTVMLKRASVALQTRLGDDSAFAQHSALEFLSNRANFLIRTAVAWTNGAGALTGTLTNGPAIGNPTKWIPVDDSGTTRYIPAW